VKISAPADDGKVRQCEPIEGSARLPSGTTLVLSTRDLSARTAGDPVRRWSPVDHWQRPSSLRAWRARQPFDASTSSRSGGGERSGPASQSHRFRLDVLVVDLAELRQQIRKARRSGDDWRSVARLDTAVVGDSISFNRISGICGTP
jgi:hypothetical protein